MVGDTTPRHLRHLHYQRSYSETTSESASQYSDDDSRWYAPRILIFLVRLALCLARPVPHMAVFDIG